jgi:CheY-like chemotaxis protein
LEHSRQDRERAGIPVVILSAIKGQSDYPATLGVAAWFAEPLDVARFLPAVAELLAQRRAIADASRAGQRILFIEDDQPIRSLVFEHLTEEGYRPILAASLVEARELIAAESPDMILLDLMLPSESGWDFLRSRRSSAALAGIPVLVISAAPRAQLLEAKHLGADAFLSKPFDLDVLTAMIRGLIHGADAVA